MLKPSRLFLLACLAALPLTACDTLRDSAGLTKKSPDEFAVTSKAPLVIPPDFNLRPPMPGAAPLNQTDPATTAQTALFNTDPAIAAANMTGNFSTAEKMLIATASQRGNDPSIRRQLQTDQGHVQSPDRGFTERLLGTAPAASNDAVLDPNAELARQRGTAAPAAQPEGEGGGWFDWLF